MKKIALNFIFKGNEEPEQLAKMLSSAAPFVDGIFATATWSKKGKAVKMVRNFGGKVSFFKWNDNFSDARNHALARVPKKYEYVLWLDSDDVLQGGQNIKKLVEAGLDGYFATYNYQIDEKTGQVLIEHPRERIFRRDCYVWKGMLHETAIAKREVKTAFVKDIAVNHFPKEEEVAENIKRNIRILEKAYKKEGKNHDPRTEFYLARCYFDDRQLGKAEKLFWDYLEKSGWDEERAMAYNYLSEIYRSVEKYDDAIDCLLTAIRERPEFPTWYINLGVVYGKIKDWDKALLYTKFGLSMDQPKTAMVLVPRDDTMRALETIYFACLAKNKPLEALGAADKMLKLFPNDKLLVKRKQAVGNLLRMSEVGKAVSKVVKELEDLGETEKAEALIGGLPSSISDNAFCEKLKQKYMPAKKWPKKSIVYYCGKGFEKWSPINLAQGIGGSESAVIHLCKFWSKRGYRVTVFGYPQEEGTYDGVEYLNYWRFNPKDEFDIFIGWRNETLFNLDLKARLKLIDYHDVINPMELDEERLSRIDRIMVKSQYHKQMLPEKAKKKALVVSNGFDLSLIEGREFLTDRPAKLVYSSSYDRGIDLMLKYGWPIIKKAVPKAELHIFYGWNLFDAIYKNNPERMAWKAEIQKLMKQKGVFERGRIAQSELLKEKMSANVHYYGCTFEEIDCISVRESAAVGCVPFTTDYAALKNRSYCRTTKGDPFDPETHKKLAREVVKFLEKPDKKLRVKFQQSAVGESWEKIAGRWTEEFEK
ncbi:MAG: hypothetical protein PHF35_04755 [Candidatus Moranbacteria bacterium]|nr:hypothetical protein [Candidatus Moranbacteria bacterium]